MAQALRLCPDLIVVSPNFAAYRAASQQVMERLHCLTPLVEQISIDEAFLDVTSLGESGDILAARLVRNCPIRAVSLVGSARSRAWDVADDHPR
jgi:nucleotidyltransferase/DNA polymerase involved in DNA repair